MCNFFHLRPIFAIDALEAKITDCISHKEHAAGVMSIIVKLPGTKAMLKLGENVRKIQLRSVDITFQGFKLHVQFTYFKRNY